MRCLGFLMSYLCVYCKDKGVCTICQRHPTVTR
jgi:hypothetical protein